MAHTLTVQLQPETFERLRVRAERQGCSLEDAAVSMLHDALDHRPHGGVAETASAWDDETQVPPRTSPSDYDGPHVELDDAFRSLGLSPEPIVETSADDDVFDVDDFAWIDGDPRSPDHEPIDEAGLRDWSEVRPQFTAMIEEAFGPSR